MNGSGRVHRVSAAILVGAVLGTVLFWPSPSGRGREVFAWVADRGAGCVVALDDELYEIGVWWVSEPTALHNSEGGVRVRETRNGAETWWRIRGEAAAERCAAPVRTVGSPDSSEGSAGALQWMEDAVTLLRALGVGGSPTAFARGDRDILIATPGALFLLGEDEAMERVQGGFDWISAVALAGQSSPRGSGDAAP